MNSNNLTHEELNIIKKYNTPEKVHDWLNSENRL